MIEMNDKFIRTSEEKIAAFEKGLGRPLPPQYRQFLISYNGGRPKIDEFGIPGQGSSQANFFYGIDVGKDYKCYELKKNVDVLKGRIPNELLPIADDPGGNQICISLSPDDCGRVYFWDHEKELEPDQTVIPLADSFDEFIDSLRESEE